LAKTSDATAVRFEGFPKEAATFFNGLAKNNNRDWFQSHKDTYEQAVREPMKALVGEFEPRLGRASISRINRDNRFFKDRPPYKTHIAAGIGRYYLSISSMGLYIGTGLYRPDSPTLERLRAAIDRDESGRELARIVAALRRKRYQVDTHERLASTPRGFAKDHRRADLLMMKDIHAGKLIAPGPELSSRRALDAVTRTMNDLKPFLVWLTAQGLFVG
jgi:uncharacterized protein (TIGR02453 family)